MDLLSIGAELVGTSDRERDWRVVIAGVRAVFHGPITYAANWGGEETRMRWWDAVDYIGVNAYYPLTKTTNPTVDELKDAWITKSYVGTLERLARTFNTQLILTEIGYRDGAVGAPWDFRNSKGSQRPRAGERLPSCTRDVLGGGGWRGSPGGIGT